MARRPAGQPRCLNLSDRDLSLRDLFKTSMESARHFTMKAIIKAIRNPQKTGKRFKTMVRLSQQIASNGDDASAASPSSLDDDSLQGISLQLQKQERMIQRSRLPQILFVDMKEI